jgi:hypothetical protein
MSAQAEAAEVYSLYGLSLRSAIPLLGVPVCTGAAPPGWPVAVALGESRDVPSLPAPGRLLYHATPATNAPCAYVENETGYSIRFFDLAEFVVSKDLHRVTAHIQTGQDPRYLALLLIGNLAAFLLNRLERASLHASAVSTDSGLISFLGDTGFGKTTLAASLALRGMPVFTDDLLALRADGSRVLADRGPCVLRLRSFAAEALGISTAAGNPLSCDGRVLYSGRVPAALSEAVRSVIMLEPTDAAAESCTIRPLSPMEAFSSLLRFPRTPLFSRPESLRSDLEVQTLLVRSAEVFLLQVNWAVAKSSEVAAQLVQALGLESPGLREAQH